MTAFAGKSCALYVLYRSRHIAQHIGAVGLNQVYPDDCRGTLPRGSRPRHQRVSPIYSSLTGLWRSALSHSLKHSRVGDPRQNKDRRYIKNSRLPQRINHFHHCLLRPGQPQKSPPVDPGELGLIAPAARLENRRGVEANKRAAV